MTIAEESPSISSNPILSESKIFIIKTPQKNRKKEPEHFSPHIPKICQIYLYVSGDFQL